MKLTYIYIATVLLGFIAKTAQAEAVKFDNHDEISRKINHVFNLPEESRPVLTNLRFNYDMQINLIDGEKICELLLENKDAVYHYRSAGIEVRTKDGQHIKPQKVYLITHSPVNSEEADKDSPYQAEFRINNDNVKISKEGSFEQVGSKIIDGTKFRLLKGELYGRESAFNTLFVDQISCEIEENSWSLF